MAHPAPLRVLYLKQRFDPEPAPLRGAAFTNALHNRGIDITVLTGFPYYPYASIHDGWTQRIHAVETIGDTVVHRSASAVGHTAGPVRRMLTYTTMPAMSVVNAVRNRLQADLVLTTMGPGVYAHFAVLLARRLGVPAVLEIQDLWPESLEASGMWPERLPLTPINAAMTMAYSRASAMLCLSPGCREAVVARGADPKTTVAMLNWAPTVEVAQSERCGAAELLGDWEGTDFFAYAGAIGPLQGVERMCDAAERTGSRLLVIGAGRSDGAVRARAERSELIRVVGQQPPGIAHALLRQAAASVTYLESSELDGSAIPSKLASNLTMGTPMIVAAAGETARLAERIDAGPRCSPGDTDQLVDAFRCVLGSTPSRRAQWGAAGLAFAHKWLDAESGLDRYANFLRAVSESRPIHQLVGSEGLMR